MDRSGDLAFANSNETALFAIVLLAVLGKTLCRCVKFQVVDFQKPVSKKMASRRLKPGKVTKPTKAKSKAKRVAKTKKAKKTFTFQPMVSAPFLLPDFLQFLGGVLKDAPFETQEVSTKFKWASAFDGLGSPGKVLELLLGEKSEQCWGSEKKPAANNFNLRNSSCKHLFEDFSGVACFWLEGCRVTESTPTF